MVDICRKLGVTETTFYRWKKQHTGLDFSALREHTLEESEISLWRLGG
mgnify:CR=1 FL=1